MRRMKLWLTHDATGYALWGEEPTYTSGLGVWSIGDGDQRTGDYLAVEKSPVDLKAGRRGIRAMTVRVAK